MPIKAQCILKKNGKEKRGTSSYKLTTETKQNMQIYIKINKKTKKKYLPFEK